MFLSVNEHWPFEGKIRLIFHAVKLTVESKWFCVASEDTFDSDRDIYFYFHLFAIFDNHYWLCVS